MPKKIPNKNMRQYYQNEASKELDNTRQALSILRKDMVLLQSDLNHLRKIIREQADMLTIINTLTNHRPYIGEKLFDPQTPQNAQTNERSY